MFLDPALRPRSASWWAPLALGLGLLAPSLLAGPSLAQQRVLDLEELYLLKAPSLKLSTVYKSLPDQARYGLLEKLRTMLLAQLPPGIEKHPALDQLPPDVAVRVKMILPFLKAVSPQQMDAFVQKQDLDHLAPLPVGLFQGYHQKVMAEPTPGGSTPRAQTVAADRADTSLWRQAAEEAPGFLSEQDPGMDRLELLAPGEPVPQDEVPKGGVKPAFQGMAVKASYTVETPEHVLVNSVRLARALNHLSNQTRRDPPLELDLAGHAGQAEAPVDLVNQLELSGKYDLAIYDARMFVNFVNLWVMHQGTPLSVRVPTWLDTGIDPGDPQAEGPSRSRFLVPANHSEHVLVLFAKGTRRPEAMVKWYMGIPSKAYQQGTIYKAAVWRRPSWCGYRIVHAYEGKTSVRQMVRAGGILMRLFNFIQERYGFAHNGYGVVGVCQDTTGLMEGVLQGQTGRSTVWPLIRDPGLDFYYQTVLETMGLRMRKGAGGIPVLDIPSDARLDHYPWIKDRRVELYRIGANIPFRRAEEVHLPQLRANLDALRDVSPFFARGLRMLDVRPEVAAD